MAEFEDADIAEAERQHSNGQRWMTWLFAIFLFLCASDCWTVWSELGRPLSQAREAATPSEALVHLASFKTNLVRDLAKNNEIYPIHGRREYLNLLDAIDSLHANLVSTENSQAAPSDISTSQSIALTNTSEELAKYSRKIYGIYLRFHWGWVPVMVTAMVAVVCWGQTFGSGISPSTRQKWRLVIIPWLLLPLLLLL